MTEESLFDAVLAKPREERDVFLESACAGDAEMLQRLKRLLAAHEKASGILEAGQGAGDRTAAYVGPPAIPVGALIAGRFKILECLGVGGMGTVYVAEQTQPVRRKVALKLIKPGMDSQRVLARFEAERQALAVMDHPHIAKVLDAGQTDQGRPFFVMEYIRGVPLTEYCDAARLDVPERLALFVAVCHAVQHAHQKGLIHRDLKPSNILVALYDGKPVPKVIDFGLAKAIHQPFSEGTIYTAHGMVLGTPLYMSPEQAELNNLDIDTRSDIYALGVILYELLTGATPLDRQRLKDAAWNEMLRMIREEEPPRPSIRLSGSASLPSIAAQRKMAPVRLARLLRGELDWIIMKALDKDRNRRYETANGFAMDIQRYLAEEPVQAGPPSATYRLRKFLYKHRRGVAMATTLAVLLVASVVFSTWQAIRARRAEQVATAEEQKAKKSAAEARAVLEFFQNKVLAAARPETQDGGLGINVTIRDAVDAAEREIGAAFGDQPLVEATIRNTLGMTYQYLGETELAIPQYQRAWQLRSEKLGADHPDTLQIANNLAWSYHDAGHDDQALPLLERTVDKMILVAGPDDLSALTFTNNLGLVYQAAGRLDDALRLHETTLQRRKAILGPNHDDTLQSMNNLAAAYLASSRPADALRLLKETVERKTAILGPNHPDTLIAMNDLAVAYGAAGEQDKSLPLLENTFEKCKAQLGPDHPGTLHTMASLAVAYLKDGRMDQGLSLMEQAMEKQKTKLGANHPTTLQSRTNLGVMYRDAGKLDQAIPLLEQTLEAMQAKLGARHPSTLWCTYCLGVTFALAGQLDKAQRLLQEAIDNQAKVGTSQAEILASLYALGLSFQAAGKPAEAVPIHEQTFEKRKALLGPDHPDTLMSMFSLAYAYQHSGKADKALPLFEESLRLHKSKYGPANPETFGSMTDLGQAYLAAGRLDQAESLLREAAQGFRRNPGLADGGARNCIRYLADCYTRLRQPENAEPLWRELLANGEKSEPDVWTTFNTKSLLGDSLLGQKNYADAEPLLLAGYEGMKEREGATPMRDGIGGPYRQRLTEALERLVQLYDAWGKPEQAAEWRKKLEESKTNQDKPKE